MLTLKKKVALNQAYGKFGIKLAYADTDGVKVVTLQDTKGNQVIVYQDCDSVLLVEVPTQ